MLKVQHLRLRAFVHTLDLLSHHPLFPPFLLGAPRSHSLKGSEIFGACEGTIGFDGVMEDNDACRGRLYPR